MVGSSGCWRQLLPGNESSREAYLVEVPRIDRPYKEAQRQSFHYPEKARPFLEMLVSWSMSKQWNTLLSAHGEGIPGVPMPPHHKTGWSYGTVPEWIFRSITVSVVKLSRTNLKQNDITLMERMHSLKNLALLDSSYAGENMVIRSCKIRLYFGKKN